jgi:predicted Zn-dependent peptidase
MSTFTFEKLPNKANIPAYLLDLPYLNSVSAAVIVKAGTVDEIWPHEAGLAHALEHLVLRGTKRFPSAQLLSGYIEEVGGFKKATTDYEKTMYHGQVPAQYAERLVEALAEIVNFYLIPENAISKQIQVILEEMKQKQDNPFYVVDHMARSFIFGSHPLGREVLGLEESLQKLTRTDILNFASRYYYPDNFTILLIGNLKIDKARTFIEKYFITGGKQSPNTRPKIQLIDNKKRELKFYHNVQQTHLELLAPISSSQEKSNKALRLFCEMISGGVISPLFQEIREKRGLCYNLSTFISKYSIGLFSIHVSTKPESYEEVISLILKVIEDNKNSVQLFNKTKQRVIGSLFLSFDDPDWIIFKAAQDIIYQGKPVGYQEFIKEMDSITIKDIENAVDTYLTPNNWRRILMLPKSN